MNDEEIEMMKQQYETTFFQFTTNLNKFWNDNMSNSTEYELLIKSLLLERFLRTANDLLIEPLQKRSPSLVEATRKNIEKNTQDMVEIKLQKRKM